MNTVTENTKSIAQVVAKGLGIQLSKKSKEKQKEEEFTKPCSFSNVKRGYEDVLISDIDKEHTRKLMKGKDRDKRVAIKNKQAYLKALDTARYEKQYNKRPSVINDERVFKHLKSTRPEEYTFIMMRAKYNNGTVTSDMLL